MNISILSVIGHRPAEEPLGKKLEEVKTTRPDTLWRKGSA
jgi:hypothetical protein